MSYKFASMRRAGGALLNNRVAVWLRSEPGRNVLFALFIAGILAYGAGFAGYMLANFDLINLLRDVNNDDSFYYFQIAYNLSEGKFSTFDGGITRTNGYHPIWMFAITPFYWIFDKEAALFGIKAFEIMLVAGAVACIAAAARLARLPWILLFAALPVLYQKSALFLGLEAAAALFMLGLFFLALMLYARNPARWTWSLAAVAFLLPWVRLEYVAISVAAMAALCFVEWSWRERPAGALWRNLILAAPPRTLVPVGSAIAGLLVYFLYNGLVFRGITPVSGVAKQWYSQLRWAGKGGYSLTQNFQDILQIRAFDSVLLVGLLGVCAGFLLVWWLARRCHGREDWLLLVFLVGVFGLAAGHLAKFAQSVLTVHPGYSIYGWYFVPAYLMLALIVPASCFVVVHFVRRFVAPRSGRTANILSAGVVVVAVVILLAQANFVGPFQYIGQLSYDSSRQEWEVSSYSGIMVTNRILPEGSVLGSWNSGVIGYLARFPVVNLDGLVNSYDYLNKNKQAGGINNLDKTFYQGEFGLTHFADATENPDKLFKDGTLFETASFPAGSGSYEFRLAALAPLPDTDVAARFWEQLEPHFDYQSGDIGLLVDGRLAQAFHRNCRPDEVLTVSYEGVPGKDAALWQPWEGTPSGSRPFCVARIILPHGAVPPVRIESLTAADYLAEQAGSNTPAIRSNFDVYFVANRLIYVKEQCSQNDLESAFFLHVYPISRSDLPLHRKLYGFDNLDFYGESVIKTGNTCWAEILLPGYDIAAIRTGQRMEGQGHVWQAEYVVAE